MLGSMPGATMGSERIRGSGRRGRWMASDRNMSWRPGWPAFCIEETQQKLPRLSENGLFSIGPAVKVEGRNVLRVFPHRGRNILATVEQA